MRKSGLSVARANAMRIKANGQFVCPSQQAARARSIAGSLQGPTAALESSLSLLYSETPFQLPGSNTERAPKMWSPLALPALLLLGYLTLSEARSGERNARRHGPC